MIIKLRADEYNLDNTMKPSFLSSLYRRVGKGEWVKIAGFLKGLRIFQPEGKVVIAEYAGDIEEDILRNEVILETGLWRKKPFEKEINRLSREIREKIKGLSKSYFGIRLPISPRDFSYILIAVVLSKRTDYYRFVLRWCEKIWSKHDGDLKRIEKADLRDIGSSYQLIGLKRTLKDFNRNLLRKNLITKRPEEARVLLIRSCWGIGPKVADSIILTTFKAPHFIPCDVHLRTILNRLKILEKSLSMPEKRYCMKHVCDERVADEIGIDPCPISDRCLRGELGRMFGELGGWFQTMLYLHGRNYCKTNRPRCDICPLNQLCPTAKV